MSNLRDRIEELRAEKGLSINKLAQITGIPYGSLAGVKNARQASLSSENAAILASFFGVSVPYLLGKTDDRIEVATGLDAIFIDEDAPSDFEVEMLRKYRALDSHGQKMVNLVLVEETDRMEAEAAQQQDNITKIEEYTGPRKIVRMFDTPASAGTGMPFVNELGRDISVVENAYTRKADYVLKVSGDSMEPRFHNGDLVLVQETDDVDEGEIGIFNIAGMSYIKRKGDGVLISVNPAYRNIEPEEYDYQNCQGRVIGVLDPDWILSN